MFYYVRSFSIVVAALVLVLISAAVVSPHAASITNPLNKIPDSKQSHPLELKKYRIALMSLKVLDTHSGTYPAHWRLKFAGSYTGANGIVNIKYDEPRVWNWPKGSEFNLFSSLNLTASTFVDLNVPKDAVGILVSSEGAAFDTGDIVLTQDHELGKVHDYYPKESNYGLGMLHTATSDKGDYQIKYRVLDLSHITVNKEVNPNTANNPYPPKN